MRSTFLILVSLTESTPHIDAIAFLFQLESCMAVKRKGAANLWDRQSVWCTEDEQGSPRFESQFITSNELVETD